MQRVLRSIPVERLGLLLVVALVVGMGPLVVARATAATTPPVSITDANASKCNGVETTPGSDNTRKDVVGGTLERGGTAVFRISYPVDAADLYQQFNILDCFERTDTGGVLTAKNIAFVPNNVSYTLEYTLDIPQSVDVGTQVCNYAKTTQGPSDPQKSNRKAQVCFTVGGTLRVEKQDAGTGALLPGATFTVACAPTATFPSLVIAGLSAQDGTAVTTSPVATGYATDGAIAVNGPEGTPCVVTELAAPPGYVTPAAPDNVHRYTIPATGSATGVQVIRNTAQAPVPTLAKTADPAGGTTVARGTAVQFTVTVGNTGTGPASGDVVDTLPAGFSAPSPIGSSGSWDAGARTVTWPAVAVPAGESRTLTYTARVADDAVAGPLTNSVAWLGRTATTTHTVPSLVPVLVPAPTLTKSSVPASGSTVQAGDLVSYALVAGNSGTGPLTPAVVVDTLPASFLLDPTSVSGGTFDPAAGTITWDLGTLAAGDTRTLRYSGLVAAVTAPTTLTNTATLGDRTASTTHTAQPNGLGLVKSVSTAGTVQPGSTLVYSLVATATGGVTERAVVVTDRVPGTDPQHPASGRTTLVPGSAVCGEPPTCPVTVDAATGLVTWSLGDLAPGTSRTVRFAVTVDSPATAGARVADVLNAGAVASARTPAQPSNLVVTPVTAVEAVVVTRPPATTPAATTPAATTPAAPPATLPFAAPAPATVLPFTGAWVLPGLAGGLLLSLLGSLLVATGRRRRA